LSSQVDKPDGLGLFVFRYDSRISKSLLSRGKIAYCTFIYSGAIDSKKPNIFQTLKKMGILTLKSTKDLKVTA
jgi:hypothetical protein